MADSTAIHAHACCACVTDGESGRPDIARGEPLPLGAHECCNGVNLAVFSRHATRMALLLFDDPGQSIPSARIDLDPRHHRSGDIWHAQLTGNVPGKLYTFQADGPHWPARGHRFDPEQFLLDPYAPVVAGAQDWNGRVHRVPRSAIVHQDFDWQDDAPPRISWSETVIYETHVRGLTLHPSSGALHPGQYLGVAEKEKTAVRSACCSTRRALRALSRCLCLRAARGESRWILRRQRRTMLLTRTRCALLRAAGLLAASVWERVVDFDTEKILHTTIPQPLEPCCNSEYDHGEGCGCLIRRNVR